MQGASDLEFRDLTVEVSCHGSLAQQFLSMHPRLDAAPAVVTTLSASRQAIVRQSV